MIGSKQTERREWWQQTVAEQKDSGQTVRAFCRERGVGEHSFYQWRKQLSRPGEQPVGFALVEAVKLGPSDSPLELVLSGGERRLIPADAATLELVLNVLHKCV